MRISDWSSDVCSSDLEPLQLGGGIGAADLVGRAPAQARNNGEHRRDLHLAHRSFPCSGISPEAVHSTPGCLHCLRAPTESFSWAPASGPSCATGCRDSGPAFVVGDTCRQTAPTGAPLDVPHPHPQSVHFARSEARRVGKECVSTCRSRWSPYNYKKKNTKRA